MKLENFYKTIFSELKKKKIQITLTGVKKALLEHPDYLSLQTITDYFDDMDIANTAMRIDFEQLLSAVTEAEVIVLMNDEEGDHLLWIKKINKGKIYFANAKPVTFEKFKEKWQEKAILFQIKKVKMEENYASNFKKESLWKKFFFVLLFGLLSLSIAYITTNHFSAFSILTLLPKFGGLLFAALLAAMELGLNLPITEKLCSISTNKGCEKLTRSRISYLTEDIKMADLGLIYFITNVLFLLADDTYLLGYVALFSIPLILFSVIYQTFVLKVSCPLCMSVMAMLTIDIFIYWRGGIFENFEGLSTESVLRLMGLGGVVSGCWFSVKKIIEAKNNNENYKYRYAKLHHNPKRICMLLDSIPDSDLPETKYDIFLGDYNPELTITEIMSPFCGPCGGSMKKATELMNLFSEKIQIRILFTNNKGSAEKNMEIISHLLSLSKEADQKLMIKALSDWFKIMDYVVWSKKYPIKSVSMKGKEVADYFEIIKSYQVKYTPVLYVEKKQVPANLSISDLRYYFDDILN